MERILRLCQIKRQKNQRSLNFHKKEIKGTPNKGQVSECFAIRAQINRGCFHDCTSSS